MPELKKTVLDSLIFDKCQHAIAGKRFGVSALEKIFWIGDFKSLAAKEKP